MAEQKVCADVVAVASDATGNSMLSQGELPVSILRSQSSQSSGVDDSGTESGEDLRLLSPEVLAEVQGALGKLETALPSLDPGRREALLQLVSRLQTCLQIPKPATPPNPPPPPRRFSDRNRIARRSRHTVGVSREELADARRWLQENQTEASEIRQSSTTHLPQQTNESLVSKVFRPVKFNPIIRSTSEETYFESSNNHNLEEYPIIEQHFNPILYKAEVQYMTQSQPLLASVSYILDKNTERLMGDASGSSILEYDPSSVLFTPEQSVQIAVHKAAINKQISKEAEKRKEEDSDDEEFSSTEDDRLPSNSLVSSAQRLLLMATDAKVSPNPNRFHAKNNKKMRMKRANTIDIPKPQNYYDVDGSSCDEFDRNSVDDGNLSDNNKLYRNNHGNNSNRKLPFTLEPKTANDFKFLAFLQQTSERENKGASYNPCARGGAQWSNRFTNIKTAFEPGARRQSNPNVSSVNKSMWHTLEQQQKQESESDKRHARTPQPIQKKLPWTSSTSNQNDNVVIGSITVAKKTIGPINQFSHAPKSAFKPPEKKTVTPVQPYNPPSASGTVKLLASQKFSGQNPSPKPILKQYPPQDKILNSFKPKTNNKEAFQKQQDCRGFVPYTKLPHEISPLPKVAHPAEKVDNNSQIKPYYIQPQNIDNNRVSKVVKSLESEKVNEIVPSSNPNKVSQSHHVFKHHLVKIPSSDESFNYNTAIPGYDRLTPEVSSINSRLFVEERVANFDRTNCEDQDTCPQTHFIPASPIRNPSNLYIPHSLHDTGYSSSSLKSNSSFEYSPSSPNRTANINNCFPHNFSPQKSARLESRTSSIENELNLASSGDPMSPIPTPSQYYVGQVQNNLLRIPSNLPTGRSSKTSSLDDDESASASPSFWANEEVSKITNPFDQFESQTAVTRVMGQPHQAVTVTNKMRHRHESAARKIESHILSAGNPNPSSPSFPNVLQKSESWHQMVKEKMAQAKQAPPLPKIPKAKSSHTLSFPKQFETAQPKELLQSKQSTVELYLKKSNSNAGINKLRERRSTTTATKAATSSIRLDEDLRNVDEAFESLFNETSKKRNK